MQIDLDQIALDKFILIRKDFIKSYMYYHVFYVALISLTMILHMVPNDIYAGSPYLIHITEMFMYCE
jgi:hypothetical protein